MGDTKEIDIGSFSKSCSPPSTLPNSSYDEFEEVNEAMSITESFPDAMNKYSLRENGQNLNLEELSDATQSLVKPAPVDWMKHLTILVMFGLFTFSQNNKPPETVLEDNKFEIDVLLYKRLFFEMEMKDQPKSWSHIFLMEFTRLEDLHIFWGNMRHLWRDFYSILLKWMKFLVICIIWILNLSRYLKQLMYWINMDNSIFGWLILFSGRS